MIAAVLYNTIAELETKLASTKAERDRYQIALRDLRRQAQESLDETPATQHPVLDAGSVLDLVNKTLLKLGCPDAPTRL